MRDLEISTVRHDFPERIPAPRAYQRTQRGMATTRHSGVDRITPAGYWIFGTLQTRTIATMKKEVTYG